MADDALLNFHAPWFDPKQVGLFPVAGYVNHDGVLHSPAPSRYI